MTRYRMIGRPYAHPHAADFVDRNIGDEFDADFSEADERAAVGAGVIERVDGDSLQPERTANGMESMDVPPHTAEPGVGFQEVSDEVVGEEPVAEPVGDESVAGPEVE